MKFSIGRGYLLQLSVTSVQLRLSGNGTSSIHFNPYQKGKIMAQTKKANAVDINNINLVEIATKAGQARVNYKRHTEAAETSLKEFNDAAITLHEAKVVLGKSRRTDSTLQALYDALVAGGIKGESAANCLLTFKEVVKTGKAAKGFNKSRNEANDNANGKAGVKVTPADDGKQADAALRALWNCNMAMFILDTIESAYQDGKGSDPTLAGALKWVMASRGIPFNKDGKATTESKAKAKAK